MYGSGKRHQQHHALNEGIFCVCPVCDYYTVHEAGVPCHTLTCPDCEEPLVWGDEAIGESSLLKQPLHRIQQKTEIRVPYPKVLTDKCIGCGICMNVCPANTIVWREGKAFIDEAGCRNCRICIARCPQKAIIL